MARLTTLALLFCGTLVPVAAQLSSSAPVPARIQVLLDARDLSAAEQEVKRELRAAPGWDTGHLLLAQIFLQTARYEMAAHSAAEALRIRESLDGMLLSAVAAMRLGRLNESIGWLEKAARRDPDHPEIYRILGLDYTLGGAPHEAEQAFARAMALAPANWEYQYLHGRALFEIRRHEEARAAFEKAVKLNAASPKAWTALGQAQERTGEPGSAEASYRKAIAACGRGRECGWPLLQLGFLRGVQAGPEAALPDFVEAVRARPDWAAPHFHLGKALAALDRLEEARAELERAVELDGGKADYHYQLAQVYRRLGEQGKATAQFASFRKLRRAQAEPVEALEP